MTVVKDNTTVLTKPKSEKNTYGHELVKEPTDEDKMQYGKYSLDSTQSCESLARQLDRSLPHSGTESVIKVAIFDEVFVN